MCKTEQVPKCCYKKTMSGEEGAQSCHLLALWGSYPGIRRLGFKAFFIQRGSQARPCLEHSADLLLKLAHWDQEGTSKLQRKGALGRWIGYCPGREGFWDSTLHICPQQS